MRFAKFATLSSILASALESGAEVTSSTSLRGSLVRKNRCYLSSILDWLSLNLDLEPIVSFCATVRGAGARSQGSTQQASCGVADKKTCYACECDASDASHSHVLGLQGWRHVLRWQGILCRGFRVLQRLVRYLCNTGKYVHTGSLHV